MNRFYVRMYNGGDCEVDCIAVDVPEGSDYSPAIRHALMQMMSYIVPEPGDTIKIERD